MNLTELAKELEVPWGTLKLRKNALKLNELNEDSIELLRNHFRKGNGIPGCYNNGEIEVKVSEGFLPPDGFVKGHLKRSFESKTSE